MDLKDQNSLLPNGSVLKVKCNQSGCPLPYGGFQFNYEIIGHWYDDYNKCIKYIVKDDDPLHGGWRLEVNTHGKETIDLKYTNDTKCWYVTPSKDEIVSVVSTPKKEERENTKMADPKADGFVNMVKGDFGQAGYRVTANQLTKATKTALIQALKGKGAKKAQLTAISDLLDSEAGSALIAMGLGMALTYAPVISDNPKAGVLAKEFRVGGMTTAGNAVISTVTDNLFPAVMKALNGLPEETAKVRIAEPKPAEVPAVPNQDEHSEVGKQVASK